jgi:hypothetical protein
MKAMQRLLPVLPGLSLRIQMAIIFREADGFQSMDDQCA